MKLIPLLVAVLVVSNTCVSANKEVLFGIDWTGTKALRSGDMPTALKEVQVSPQSDDTVYRDFKLGVVNYHLKNYSSALSLLRGVVELKPELAPVAYVYIAEIEQKLGRTGNCLAAYRAVLRGNIPPRYRHTVYEKLRVIVEADSTLTLQQAPWLEEYYRWSAPQKEEVVFTTIDTIATLLKQKQWGVIDSLLANDLLAGSDACGIVKAIRSALEDDSLSVQALFKCAMKAQSCGELTIATQFFGRVKKRKNVFDTIPEQDFDDAIARLHYNKDDWREAIRKYKKLVSRYGKNADAYMSIARAYRKLGNEKVAAVWYEKLMADFPRHPMNQEILWLRAWQNEDRKRYRNAASYYRRIITRYTTGKRVDESYIRLALCYYNQKQYDSARSVLETFVEKKPNSSKLLAGYYWQAKCYIASGNKKDAITILRLVSRKEPFDYYAHRSRQVLLELGDTTDVLIDTGCTGTGVLAWFDSLSRRGSDSRSFTARDSLYYLCGLYLASVGDVEKADYFLEPIELGYPGNLSLQYTLALLYMRVGASAPAFRIARRLTWRIPQADRTEMPLDVYKLFYPPFYAEFITEEAKKYGVDPFLISAVMRQESIFNPQIVSPAGAVGLMQIMPYTGKYIAEKMDAPFTTDSLYSAEYNIKFGVFYVHELLEQMGGDTVLTLASYNAGPHNAKRWAKENRGMEFDLFVEDIGFTETRGYVKKVMANCWTYRLLAGYPSYAYSTSTLERMSSLPAKDVVSPE